MKRNLWLYEEMISKPVDITFSGNINDCDTMKMINSLR